MLIVYVIFGVLMLWLLRLPCLHTTVNTSDIYIYIYIYIYVYMDTKEGKKMRRLDVASSLFAVGKYSSFISEI